MDEQTYKDLEVAQQALQIKGRTLVLVDNNKVFSSYSDHPLPRLHSDIEYIADVVVGVHFLGKAAAMLCAHGKARAVSTPQATKTALAVLIRAGIPCQTDKMIPELPVDSPLFDAYEQKVQHIDDPQEWFVIMSDGIKE